MNSQSKPSFWEFTKQSARDATRQYFAPLAVLGSLRPQGDAALRDSDLPGAGSEQSPVAEFTAPSEADPEPPHGRNVGSTRDAGQNYVQIYSQPSDATGNANRRMEAIQDRPATASDLNSGTQKFDIQASGQEPVVRSSRVVEEVLIGRQVSESICDVVRTRKSDLDQTAEETSPAARK